MGIKPDFHAIFTAWINKSQSSINIKEMEEATRIFSYLPLHYKNVEETEYVQYLWKAFENSIKTNNISLLGSVSISVSRVSLQTF